MTATPQKEEGWQVKLEIFEGPLDLLLHLVRKQEVNIREVPISSITAQYLEYLDLMRELNLNVAGDYLLLAASLVYLKSRSLIPVELLQSDTDGEEGDVEDPQELLYRTFEEHKKFREAALRLAEKRLLQESYWPRGSLEDELDESGEPYLEVTLFDLIEAFRTVRERLELVDDSMKIQRKRASIQEKVLEIVARMRGQRSLEFQQLFEPNPGEELTKSDLIATFLALLELMRLQVVRVLQRARFSILRVFRLVTDDEMEKRCHERFRNETTD